MANLAQLLQNGLVYGALMSAVMTAFLIGVARANPEIMVGDYPPDIQAKYGKLSEKSARQKRIAGLLMIPVIFAPIVLGLIALARMGGGEIAFWQAALTVFMIITTFNIVDWLIIDWLLFVTIQPRWIILPGTEGMAGYKNYLSHFQAFLKGLAGSAVAGLLFGGIAWLASVAF